MESICISTLLKGQEKALPGEVSFVSSADGQQCFVQFPFVEENKKKHEKGKERASFCAFLFVN